MAFKRVFAGVGLCFCSCVLGGCKPAETSKPDAETQAKLVAKLSAADRFDGTEDKIVSKCTGCALGMDGSEQHAVETAGYTLYLCSDRCEKAFRAKPIESVLTLRIPEK